MIVSLLAVPMTHLGLYLIVQFHISHPILDRFEYQAQLIIITVGLSTVITTGSQRQCRRRRVIVITVRIIERQGRPTLTTQILIQTACISRRTHIVLTRPTGREIQSCPRSQFGRNLGCHIVTVQAFVTQLNQTSVVQVVQGEIIVHLFRTSGSTDVMFLRESHVLINYVIPVHIVVTGCITVLPVTVGTGGNGRSQLATLVVQNSLQVLIREVMAPTRSIVTTVIEISGKCIRVHSVRHVNRRSPTETVVVVNLGLACLTGLGCNQDNTERSTGTIDGRSCRILQYGYIFNILRIHGVQVTFHTVNQDKRRTA